VRSLGLELVGEVRGGGDDEYAYVVRHREERRAVVVFRGSCTLKNVATDLDYRDADHKAMVALANESGMLLPTGMNLHRGFVAAYLALRQELVELLGELSLEDGPDAPPLTLHVTGHSMGGAMAMLAALEIDHLSRCGGLHVGHVQTTTFAAPRLGDAKFASLWQRTFPDPSDFWALQVPSDAVPHLPFAAWGFRHPQGTVKLGEVESDVKDTLPPKHLSRQSHPTAKAGVAPRSAAAPKTAARVTDPLAAGRMTIVARRLGDPGDSIDALRPRDGNVQNWVSCHDMTEYLSQLHKLASRNPVPLAVMPKIA